MRGKHERSAAVRHEMASSQGTIATQRRQIDQLTSEVSDLRSTLCAERIAAKRREHYLCEQRDTAIGPQVVDLTAENQRLRAEMISIRAGAKTVQDNYEKVVQRLHDTFRQRFSLTKVESMELISQVLGQAITINTTAVDNAERVIAIQKARGERHG